MLLSAMLAEKEHIVSIQDKTTLEAVISAYDDHLHRTCGLCEGTRRGYEGHVRGFLRSALGDDPFSLGDLDPQHVLAYIDERARSLKPRTVKFTATSIRSFFRFLRMKGVGAEGLENAVPAIPEWRLSSLPSGLDEDVLVALLASLRTSTPRLQRDRAMILCLARLGLRAGEVADIKLDDIDWRAGTLRVCRRSYDQGRW